MTYIQNITSLGACFVNFFSRIPSVQTLKELARNFFKELLLRPDQNLTSVMLCCVVFIGMVLGIVYLIKRVYEKYFPA